MGRFKLLTYYSVETLYAAYLIIGYTLAFGRTDVTRIQCSNCTVLQYDCISLISKLKLVDAPFSRLGANLGFF